MRSFRAHVNKKSALTALYPRTIPTPGPLYKLGIDGVFRTVGVVAPQYAGASVSLWDLQAKG